MHGPLRVFDPGGSLVATEGEQVWVGGVARASGTDDPACPIGERFGVTWMSTINPITPP